MIPHTGGEIAKKGENIGWAISIIEGLRTSLDREAGGEVANSLDSLYTYMEEHLVLANVDNNVEMLDEVSKLLKTVKSAWDEIGGQAQEAVQQPMLSDPILNTTVR